MGISIWRKAQADSKRELTNEISVINKKKGGERQLCLKPRREVTASESKEEVCRSQKLGQVLTEVAVLYGLLSWDM